MSIPQALDHEHNIYLVVTVSPSSPYYTSAPLTLQQAHPTLTAHGQVGELQDIHLLSVPRDAWPDVRADVISALNALDGVVRVDVQDGIRIRAKRGGHDEF